MPWFRYLIHGRTPTQSPTDGFWTTRTFWGVSERQARQKVISSVTEEFGGEARIETSTKISIAEALKMPNTGASFYENDDESA